MSKKKFLSLKKCTFAPTFFRTGPIVQRIPASPARRLYPSGKAGLPRLRFGPCGRQGGEYQIPILMMETYYIYILKSIDYQRSYVGIASDPEKRLIEHNSGKTKSTKHFTSWKIIHTERFKTRIEARKREIFLKSGAGREWIKRNFFP